jgi:hypothetical protein
VILTDSRYAGRCAFRTLTVLPDDFPQDILGRHESLDIAVFVDHECRAAVLLAKCQQLFRQRRALGHEIRLAHLA